MRCMCHILQCVGTCLVRKMGTHYLISLATSSPSPRLSTSFPPALVLYKFWSFQKGTGPRGDSLRPRHFLDLLGGSATSLSNILLARTHVVLGLLLDGRAPPRLVPFLASAPLVAKVKHGEEVGPLLSALFGVGLHRRWRWPRSLGRQSSFWAIPSLEWTSQGGRRQSSTLLSVLLNAMVAPPYTH